MAFNLAQMALPKSMSKPTSLLSGVLYSKGAYADSVPKRMVFHYFAWTVLLSATATNVVESSNFFCQFFILNIAIRKKSNLRNKTKIELTLLSTFE